MTYIHLKSWTRPYWHTLHPVDWQYAKLTFCTGLHQLVMTNQSTPYYWRLYPIQHFHTSSLEICIQWWRRDTDIITSTSTHWMKHKTYCLIWWLQETYLLLSIIVQIQHEQRHIWNVTNPHHKFLRPLSETKWNMTNSIIYWDLHILMTTKTNLTRQIEILNGYGNESYI